MKIGFSTVGWLIGYFVLFSPLRMMQSYDPISALIHGIFGVGVAVLMEWKYA